MLIKPLWGLAIAVGGQMAFLAACSAPLTDSPSYRPCDRSYGAEGDVSPSELQLVRYLAWPQTYDDLTGAIGYPTHRTEWADFYRVDGTKQWLVIYYDGSRATGFGVSTSDLQCSP